MGTDDLEDHCRATIDLDRLRLSEVVLAPSSGDELPDKVQSLASAMLRCEHVD
jgi:hypothetical protein